jgi:hypothetical protein
VKINGALESDEPVGSVAKTGSSFSYLGCGAMGEAELCLSALRSFRGLHLMGWTKPKYLVKIVTNPS